MPRHIAAACGVVPPSLSLTWVLFALCECVPPVAFCGDRAARCACGASLGAFASAATLVTTFSPLHISLTSFAAGVGQSAGAPPLNLVVAKGSRLEVHLVSPHGLSLLLDLPIFGTITALQVHS